MNSSDLFNSFFVPSNLGDSFLSLDDKEQLLASIVFPLVLDEASRRQGVDVKSETSSFDVKVETTKENLKKILELFKEVHTAREEFIKSFPEWGEIRKRNIEELRSTADSLHKDRFNCNVSRLVGSSVGIVGGATLITCLLFPPAAAVVLPLSIAGGGVSLAGGGVVFGTTATEYSLIKTKMSKCQHVLKDDQNSFHPMAMWFEHNIALVEAVETVVGFQVMETLAKDLKDFASDVRSWNSVFENALKNTLAVIFDADNSFINSLGIRLASIVLTFCVVVILAHSRNYVILDSVVLTHRLVFGLLSGLDLGVEVGRGIMMAVRGGQFATDISCKLARAVFHGFFGGIGLTLDVINIILTSIDVQKGSWSKQGIQVKNAADQLNLELEFLRKVYDGLNQEETLSAFPISIEAPSNKKSD